MESIKHHFKIYFLIVSQHIKSRVSYRADFIISTFGMTINQLSGLFVLWLLFHNIRSINDWGLYEIIFLYGFVQLATLPMHLCFNNLWDLRTHLQMGTFIKYYMRPLNTLFYYIVEVFDIKSIGQLIISITALYYAGSHLSIDWNLEKVIILAISFFAASIVYISLMIIAAATGFWTMSPQGALLFTSRLREYSHYPMDIFSNVFRLLFTYIIPIGFIAYYPMKALLKPEHPNPEIYFLPIISLVFFLIAYQFWQKGLIKYEGTGS